MQSPSLKTPAVFLPAKRLLYMAESHVTDSNALRSQISAVTSEANMADKKVLNLCKSLFSSSSSSINAKFFRYFTRYLSSTATNLNEENRICFVTDGCSTEELETVQGLVVGNLEVCGNFISEEEQTLLLKEIEPYLKRQKYQYDHWDNVSVITASNIME